MSLADAVVWGLLGLCWLGAMYLAAVLGWQWLQDLADLESGRETWRSEKGGDDEDPR